MVATRHVGRLALVVCAWLAACGSDSDGGGGTATGGSAGTASGGTAGSVTGGSSGTGGAGGTSGTGGAASTGGAAGSGGAGGTSGAGGTGGAAGAGGASPTCAALAKGPHEATDRPVPNASNRAYDVHVPQSYDCTKPAPVVLALHGGGGNKLAAGKVTCPSDSAEPTNLNAPGCLNAVADQKGFVVVYPNGTKSPLLPNQDVRTFNAGGGKNGYTCVSGHACTQNVDELAYFNALLDDLGKLVNVDPKRVFATGLSNGGAMSHKLACLLSSRIAAVASVAGGNQYAAGASCAPSRPVPVLQIHGDKDGCWPYLGGQAGCTATGNMVTTPAVANPAMPPSTIAGWVQRNACGATPTGSDLPDPSAGDGTIHLDSYGGCQAGAEVLLYTINGGGHFWPGGYTYNPALTGTKNKDINASEVILDFFAKHPMP